MGGATVDGSEVRQAPVDMVNIPLLTWVSYIPGGCFGFLNHQQYGRMSPPKNLKKVLCDYSGCVSRLMVFDGFLRIVKGLFVTCNSYIMLYLIPLTSGVCFTPRSSISVRVFRVFIERLVFWTSGFRTMCNVSPVGLHAD